MSMSDLPSREQLETAISPWWGGGGRSRVILDVLRKNGANLDEAKAVAERLAVAAEAGLHLIRDETVEDALEMARASHAVRGQRHDLNVRGERQKLASRYPGLRWDSGKGWVWASGESPYPDFDPDKCVYADGVRCWQCSKIYGEVIVHGHLLSPDELVFRFSEIRALLAARVEEKL